MRYKLIILCYISVFVLSAGYTLIDKKLFPYNHLKEIKNEFVKFYLANLSQERIFSECEIREISALPNSFSVIVGHAYGSPKLANDKSFLSKNLEVFLNEYDNKIRKLIFTGDVFYVPSASKWNRLYTQYNVDKIFVAPGNHDILNPALAEIFYNSSAYHKEFPYLINVNELKVIIDNSIQSDLTASLELINIINNTIGNLIIARHNVPIFELKKYANGGADKLPKADEFIRNFNNNKITWIIGDGGAFESKPRLLCKEYLNHRFIINGLGDIDGDRLIVIINNEIFQYNLDKK